MAVDSRVMRARLHLLGQLRAGTRPPGAAISVKETAGALRLSATPVREALACLVGEGLVVLTSDRNGFAVPRLTVGDYVDACVFLRALYEVVIEAEPFRASSGPASESNDPTADPSRDIEAVLDWIVGDHGNRAIVRAVTRVGLVLVPYRRVEPIVFPDWLSDLRHLAGSIRDGSGRSGLATYWGARIRDAGRVVEAVERIHAGRDIFRI